MVLELSTDHASKHAYSTASLVEDVQVVVHAAAVAVGEIQVVELLEVLLEASVVEDVVAVIPPAVAAVEDVQVVKSPDVWAAKPWVVRAATPRS